jgi:hypothetical protein
MAGIDVTHTGGRRFWSKNTMAIEDEEIKNLLSLQHFQQSLSKKGHVTFDTT